MVEHGFFERFEFLVETELNGSEHLKHLLRVREASAARETVRLRPDKHQVQQRVVVLHVECERGGHGNGFFKNLPVKMVCKRVQNERVADEKFILELFDDRFAR